MKLSSEILASLVAFPCPRCGYEVEIQLLDARVQAYRFCPCCRSRIHLVDADGSMFGAFEEVDLAMQQLTSALKGIF
jgi:DNA replicative helicase MCM subunit Mcm2 (Cdc46/Mcm family)